VLQVDVRAPFDKGRLVVRRHIHRTALHGCARQGPYLGGIPRLAALVGLEHELWGALELVSSRSGSNARALVVPDFVNLRHLFEPLEGQAPNP
jgi:hypothetical protein